MASRTVYNCTPTFSIRRVAPKVLIGREAKAPAASEDSRNARRFMRAFYTEIGAKNRYSAGKGKGAHLPSFVRARRRRPLHERALQIGGCCHGPRALSSDSAAASSNSSSYG